MKGRKCIICGGKIAKNSDTIIIYYDPENDYIILNPNGKSGIREVVCQVCTPRIPDECIFHGIEYDYDQGMIETKLIPYVKKKFEENSKCTFPTVAECARALKVRQGCIEQMVEDSLGALMLTGYGDINERLGGLYVEIL